MKSNRILAVTVPIFLLHFAALAQENVLTLKGCLEMASYNDAYLRNAWLGIDAAKEQKAEALAEYFPKVSLNAVAFGALDPLIRIGVKDVIGNSDMANNLNYEIEQIARKYGINPVYEAMQYGYSTSVSVIQPIYAGGRIVNGNRLAAAGVDASVFQRNLQARKTVTGVEQAYWQTVSLTEKLLAIKEAEALLDTLSRDVSAACRAGLATETDVLQVQVKRNELAVGEKRLINGIRLSKMNLLNMIGYDYNPYSTVKNSPYPYIDDIVLSGVAEMPGKPGLYWRDENEITANRDEAKLLDVSVRAKKLQRKMTLGEVLPQVGIGGSYSYSKMLTSGRNNGFLFATVQIPVTDWGKYSHRLKREGIAVVQAENERDYLYGQLILQARQLWSEMVSCWDQLEVAEEGVALAEATLNNVRAHYKAGLVTISEVLQAQTAYRQAVDTRTDQAIAYRNAVSAYRNL